MSDADGGDTERLEDDSQERDSRHVATIHLPDEIDDTYQFAEDTHRMLRALSNAGFRVRYVVASGQLDTPCYEVRQE